MSYLVQVIINDELCTVCDVNAPDSPEAALSMFQELAAAESFGDTGLFDAILESHGCTSTGRGFMRNEYEGFPIVARPNGTVFTNINNIEHEIINPDYVPQITSNLLNMGGWSRA